VSRFADRSGASGAKPSGPGPSSNGSSNGSSAHGSTLSGRSRANGNGTPGDAGSAGRNGSGSDGTDPRYRWIALSNTTLSMTMATIDASIVIIAMPAIFRGIKLDPLAPGNVSYLLWMIIGYLLVTAVAVVTLGRLGDMYGRVRIYNLGFVVFTLASIALSLDPLTGSGGALWLIGFRMIQALGGAMLMSNAAAILTDAFPAGKRGMALGVNQIAGISGQFVGLLLGGLLAAVDWRLVFWVNVPIGIVGTIWSYKSSAWAPPRCWSRSPTGSSPMGGTPPGGPTRGCWPACSAVRRCSSCSA
jgi:MFS family permease